MDPQFIFGLAVFTAIAVPAFVLARRGHKKREAAFATAAADAGYTYVGKPGAPISSLLLNARASNKGTSRRLNYSCTGSIEGVDFHAVELKYNLGQQTCFAHIACFAVPANRVPAFFLRAEQNAGDKLAMALGGQDIDFEGDEPFNARYRLTSGDENTIRTLFTPELRERLAQTNLTPSLESLPGNAERAWIVSAPGFSRKLDPKELATFVDRAHRLVAPLLEAANA